MATKIKIGGELEPKTTEGVLGDASTIVDRTNYTSPKTQDTINAEKINFSDIKDADSAGAVNWDDTNKPVSARTAKIIKEYIETKLPDDVLLDAAPAYNSDNAVKSGGVFNEIALSGVYDVSAKNPIAGPNNDGKFASLSALLSDANLSTLIPTSVRKGGMSIKFVQSSDNKYVQYRLMADEWSIDTEDWAIADEGVYVENPEFVYVNTDAEGKILWAIKTDGGIYYGAGCPQQVIDYIEEKITELSLDEYEDIVAFLSDYLGSDTTLKVMIDSINERIPEITENPEFLEVTTDADYKILEAIKVDGTKEIYAPINTLTLTDNAKDELRGELKEPEIVETSYFVSDWIRGYWEDDENPTLIRTYYKLRNYDWLHLKAGTKIDIFFNGYNREACVDVWNEQTKEPINVKDWKSEDFSVTLTVDSIVLITTTSPDQYVNPSTQVVTAKITYLRNTYINDVAKLRIAAFNDGDYSGEGIVSGSDDAKTAFRQLFNEMMVDIMATQEDNEYFNSSLQTLPKDEIYGMFRYNDRVGNAPINYHSFCSNYKIDNVRPVTYKLSDSLPPATHVIFQIGELYLNGKCICLCNVHFDWFDINTRAAQIDKVIEYCSKYEYSIILGDMNPDNREGTDSQHSSWVDPTHKNVYAEDWAKFSEAGYSMVSNGYYGVFNTVMGTKDDDTAGWVPCDNIFVSQNIQITNAQMIEKEWMNDHRPIIADIVIY